MITDRTDEAMYVKAWKSLDGTGELTATSTVTDINYSQELEYIRNAFKHYLKARAKNGESIDGELEIKVN